jgi:hypothetical protein
VLGDQVAEHIQTCLARVWGPGGRRSNPVSPIEMVVGAGRG